MADEGTDVTKETDAYDAEALTSLHVSKRRRIPTSWHILAHTMQLENIVLRSRPESIRLIISLITQCPDWRDAELSKRVTHLFFSGEDCLLKRTAECDRVMQHPHTHSHGGNNSRTD